MDNFEELIRKQSEYKSVREDKYKQDSRDRLSKILKKKVETTMIGALSSMEDHFSFLSGLPQLIRGDSVFRERNST